MQGRIWVHFVISCLVAPRMIGAEPDRMQVDELTRLVESSKEARLRAILRLREVGDERAIPVLSTVLDESRGFNSAWRFAAAQALCCIGTDQAHGILKQHLLGLDYALDASVRCAFDWSMDSSKRDEFILRYHLRNISTNLVMSLKVEPLMRAGRREFAFDVTLRNVSDRAMKVLQPEDHFGDLVWLATADGHFAERFEARHGSWHKPIWRALRPGRTLRIRFQGRLRPRADLSGVLPRQRYRTPGTLGLDFGETIHIIDQPGKMLVRGYFFLAGVRPYTALMWESGKPRKRLAFEGATASAGRVLDEIELMRIAEEDPDLWVGRIVSEPVGIDLSGDGDNTRYGLSQPFAPRDPQEVEVLWEKPAEAYTVIGHFRSRGNNPKSLQKRAAKIGANAVIVTSLDVVSAKTDRQYRMPQPSFSHPRIAGEAIRYE